MTLNNAIILGNIYDPDTDCQYILLRCTAKEWEEHLKEEEENE